METWIVSFTWNGRQYVEQVACTGPTAAAAMIRAKYAGAYIGRIERAR